MAEAPPLEEDEYFKFYGIDEPVIKFEEGVNEFQHIQCILIEIADEQAKNKVWSEVISLIEQEQLTENTKARGKAQEVLVASSMLVLKCSR